MGFYLALLLENGEEPKAWEYKRCAIELEPNDGSCVNMTSIMFPWSRCRWGKVTAIGLTEMMTGGGKMIRIELPEAHDIDVGTQVEVAAGSIVITRQEQRTIWQHLKEG
jgi:hypothetical protein